MYRLFGFFLFLLDHRFRGYFFQFSLLDFELDDLLFRFRDVPVDLVDLLKKLLFRCTESYIFLRRRRRNRFNLRRVNRRGFLQEKKRRKDRYSPRSKKPNGISTSKPSLEENTSRVKKYFSSIPRIQVFLSHLRSRINEKSTKKKLKRFFYFK